LGFDFLDQYYNPLRDLATLLNLDLKELADPKSVWPEKLVIGFFAGDDANEVLDRNQPFADYLSDELGIEVELFTGTSYTAVIEAMRAKRVDGMQVGPFSYILAVQEAGAEALGASVYSREEVPVFDETLPPYYYSVIFTKKGSGIASLDDLKGKGFNFVDPASTSGHLMPKTTLLKNGIDPDDPANDMTTVFAGSHPTSVISVWNDKADAGATYESNLYRLRDEGQIDFCGFEDNKTSVTRTPEEIQAVYDACPEGSIVILAYSDPIPSTPFAVRSDLPRSLKLEIRELILDIKDNPDLIAQTGFWYLDPSPEFGYSHLDLFYNPLRDIAQLLDLDLKELANQ
jgi:phosphonate transport system substrate-binding protein